MDRGNELEGQARSIYELERGIEVEQVGFIEYDEFTGCSPDGLIGGEGLIEIKCLNDDGHFNLFLEKKINTAYIWQIQMQLLITERKWCDFVSYNPNFKHSLIVVRIYPDKKQQENLLQGLIMGKEMILNIKQQYEKRLYS
jgi:hypothetical protein